MTFKEGELDKLDNWIREIKLSIKYYNRRQGNIENKRDKIMLLVQKVEEFIDSLDYKLYQYENKEKT